MRHQHDPETAEQRAGRQESRADRQTAWMVEYQDRVSDLISTSDDDTDEGVLERRRLDAMTPPTTARNNDTGATP